MTKNQYSGKFIVFEGVDGSGKSTQSKLLADKLNEFGHKSALTYEPYKNTSLKTREDLAPLERQRFFVEDRLLHLKEFIIPNLENGINVISDRYCFSTVAYGMSEGIAREDLFALHKNILGDDFVIPDLSFFIDLEIKKAMERLSLRDDECGYFEKGDKMENIRKLYLDIFDNEGLKQKYNIKLINSDRPIENVAGDILAETLKIF